MLRILGVCIAALFGFAVALNAALMLFSPRCWFRLPTWIALRGSMREARYVTGSGAIETRLTGAGLLVLIAWMLYEILL